MSTWPQWTYATMLGLTTISMLFQDGKKGDRVGAACTVIIIGMMVAVLYCGGFWAPWGLVPDGR